MSSFASTSVNVKPNVVQVPRVLPYLDDASTAGFRGYIDGRREKQGVVVKQDACAANGLITSSTETSFIRTTHVVVDSADRDSVLWKKPNDFEIFLGRAFRNIQRVTLTSVSLPNTDAVINSSNCYIYWRLREDIDNSLVVSDAHGQRAYPVYTARLRIGSYSAVTLAQEMTERMNMVRRKAGLGDFHFFVVTLDIETDVVTFVSLIPTQLTNNPLSTTVNSGLITVTAARHGLVSGTQLYMLDLRTTSGIDASVLNGFQTITVLDSNSFTFEVNIGASQTGSGGGNTARYGVQSPFQLLLGPSNENSVAPRIGFPLTDSDTLLCNPIVAQDMAYLCTLRLTLDNRRPSYARGMTAELGTYISGVFLVARRVAVVALRNDELTVLVGDGGLALTTTLNYVRLWPNELAYALSEAINMNQFFRLIVSTLPHGVTNRTDTVSVYSATATPELRSYTPFAVLDDYRMIVKITQLQNRDVDQYVALKYPDPITPQILDVVSFTWLATLVLLRTAEDHNLTLGDTVRIQGADRQVLTVAGVRSDKEFYIVNNTRFNDLTFTNIAIATTQFRVSLAHHGFNQISLVTVDDATRTVVVQLFLDHDLQLNDTFMLCKTNTIPPIDGRHVVLNRTSDTVTFAYPEDAVSIRVPVLVSGFIGFDTQLHLNHIQNQAFESITFEIRLVIDKHTLLLGAPGFYGTGTSLAFGGDEVFVSSMMHGFRGVQTNTRLGRVLRSINLDGENYTYLVSPQLATLINTSGVDNVFAQIILDQAPGYVCFKFVSVPKTYELESRANMENVRFSVVNRNNEPYEFNDLDFSFMLEIQERVDISASASTRKSLGF